MIGHTGTRRFRRLGLIVSVALLGATVLTGTSLAGSHSKDRFVPSASDEGESESREAAEMHDLQHFDEEAAEHPVTGSQSLFSQCRFAPFANQTNLYAPLAANEHDLINGDTESTFADGVTHCFDPQNEQNIVINPTDRTNIVTSANDYRYGFGICWVYVSWDSGATWTDVRLPGWTPLTGSKGQFTKTGCGGDPVVAFGPDGTLYFAALTYNLDKFPRTMSGVAVAASHDKGAHWDAPVMVSYHASGDFFYDKEWIGVGNDGTVFMSWTKFYQGPRGLGYIKSPIVIASSRNQGKSWTSVKEVSDASHPYNQGSQVAMAPDGALYVTFETASPDSGYVHDAVALARSTDGGTSFGPTVELARAFDDLDCYPRQVAGGQGRQTLTNEQFRLPLNPILAIDPSNGRLVVTWADNEGAGNCGDAVDEPAFIGVTSNQVKVVTSTNGTSWSTVQRITTTAADKFLPSVGANDGLISVGYFTRDYNTGTTADPLCLIKERDDTTGVIVAPEDPVRATANVCLDWAVKTSSDGGATWSSQIRVSSQSSNPYVNFAGSFVGDYEGTAVDDQGRTYTVWTDSRGNPGVTTPNQDTLVGILGDPRP